MRGENADCTWGAIEQKIQNVESCADDDFRSLVIAAQLDPKTAFRFATLATQNFRGSDLTGFDFSGANLVGSSFAGARLGNAIFKGASVDIASLSMAADWNSAQYERILRAGISVPSVSNVNEPTSALSKSAAASSILLVTPPGLEDDAVQAAAKRGIFPRIMRRLPATSREAYLAIRSASAFIGVLRSNTQLDLPHRGASAVDEMARMAAAEGKPVLLFDLSGSLDRSVSLNGAQVIHLKSQDELVLVLPPAISRFVDQMVASKSQEDATSIASLEAIFPMTAGPPINKEEADYVHRICRKANMPPAFDERLVGLMRRRSRLDAQSTESSLLPAGHSLIVIADALRTLQAKHLTTPASYSTAKGQAYFLIKIEEAICRIQSGEHEQLRQALHSLSNLKEEYGDRPTLWLRLAQCYANLLSTAADQDVESIGYEVDSAFTRCIATLSVAAQNGREYRCLRMSEVQFKYLREHASRLYSFQLWRMAERVRLRANSHSKRRLLDLVGKAYSIAHAEIDVKSSIGSRWRILNNAVFYGAEAIQLRAEFGDSSENAIPSIAQLTDLTNRLAQTEAARSATGMLVWDTIAFARQVLGDVAGAKEAAWKLLDFYRLNRRQWRTGAEAGYQKSAVDRALEIVAPKYLAPHART